MAAEPQELSYTVVYVSGDDQKDKQLDDKFADPDLLKTKPWISNKYVSFQNNKDEKSRELKTIYVDANGWFLKFLIHENYPNKNLNEFDQVGIMKIKPFGYYLADKDSEESGSEEEFGRNKNPKRKTQPKKAYSDEEFEGSRKSSAKLSESKKLSKSDFPQHDDKNYSTEMREIQKILERKKRDAVTNEQFALAKKLKYGTDTLRQKQSLGLKRKDFETREAEKPRRVNSSGFITTNPYIKRENTVLPAIANHNTTSDYNEDDVLSWVPDRDRSEVTQAINIFGIEPVKNVYSKAWDKRKAGMEQLKARLEAEKEEAKEASYMLQPLLQILRRGLRDKVFAVYSAALDLLRHILEIYLPQHKLQKTGGKDAAERTYYLIITRTGDSVVIGRAYASYILRPFQATGYPKIDQGHAEIAEKIVINQSPNEKLICPFCGEKNMKFDEKGLDEHYLKSCPMLKKCYLCKQMVEISTLKEHCLEECNSKDQFQECPRCNEPLLPEPFQQHLVEQKCQVASDPETHARCLLCHKDIGPPNDDSWRRHLIGPKGCPSNPRRFQGIGGSNTAGSSMRKDKSPAPPFVIIRS